MKNDLLEKAKLLPPEERAHLAEALWESALDDGFDPDLTEEENRELHRRYEAFKDNPSESLSWKQVQEKAKRKSVVHEDLLDQRLEEHRKNPDDTVSFANLEADLDATFGPIK